MAKRKRSKGQTTMYKTLRCLVHLYLQLFVRGRMSYLRYLRFLCLFTYSGVQRILCCVFDLFFFFSSSCLHYVACLSGLSIFDFSFSIL
jgi:hypothetical protein